MQYPKSRIIFYDEEMDMPMALCYLKAGIDGYISKSDSEIELIDCIKLVLEGKKYICKKLSKLTDCNVKSNGPYRITPNSELYKDTLRFR